MSYMSIMWIITPFTSSMLNEREILSILYYETEGYQSLPTLVNIFFFNSQTTQSQINFILKH